VAVRFKASVCCRLIAGIAGLKPAEGTDVHLSYLLCCVGSGLCDGLIPRVEESYSVCVCLIMCDLETSTMGRRKQECRCCVAGKESKLANTRMNSYNVKASTLCTLKNRKTEYVPFANCLCGTALKLKHVIGNAISIISPNN
jgi:hypothetical protein